MAGEIVRSTRGGGVRKVPESARSDRMGASLKRKPQILVAPGATTSDNRDRHTVRYVPDQVEIVTGQGSISFDAVEQDFARTAILHLPSEEAGIDLSVHLAAIGVDVTVLNVDRDDDRLRTKPCCSLVDQARLPYSSRVDGYFIGSIGKKLADVIEV